MIQISKRSQQSFKVTNRPNTSSIPRGLPGLRGSSNNKLSEKNRDNMHLFSKDMLVNHDDLKRYQDSDMKTNERRTSTAK